MNNLKRLNEAMNYIEDNLDGEIDMTEVGKIALCSEFHFSKMFSYLAQMSLSEYVRKRRLSLAGENLRSTDLKVIDIAIKYNYTSRKTNKVNACNGKKNLIQYYSNAYG